MFLQTKELNHLKNSIKIYYGKIKCCSLDDDRRLNAQRFDNFFYQHQGAEPEMPHYTEQPVPEESSTYQIVDQPLYG